MKPQVYLLLLVLWRKLKPQKRHFENNWPLRLMQTQSLNACYFKCIELGFQMQLHNNVNLVVPCSIFFVPLLHCAVCQGNLGYIIGLSFSSLSGLSTKKLQTQYCPVRFTWHRGSIMLPCQQKTNKAKNLYIPSPIRTQMNFVRFCFWAELKISAILLNYPTTIL